MRAFLIKEKHVLIAVAALVLGIAWLAWYTGVGEPRTEKKTFAGSLQHAHGSPETDDWWDSIELVFTKKGIDAAFDLIAELYAREPAFAKNCHGFVHGLGKAAYRQFRERGF